MSLSPHIKYGFICIVVITIHIAVLIVVLDHRDFPNRSKNVDSKFKRSPNIYNYKPSVTFISADKQGFQTEWTKVILEDEPQIEGYKLILWEVQNVTTYVQVKNSVTKKMELLKETRYPESIAEWKEAYLEDKRVEWVVEGKDNTRFSVKHSMKPYTWYDLEIVTLFNGEEGASERNNRFQVSN